MKSDIYNKVVLLQNCLIDCATGKDYNIKDYEDTRKILLTDSNLKNIFLNLFLLVEPRNSFGLLFKRNIQHIEKDVNLSGVVLRKYFHFLNRERIIHLMTWYQL